MILYGSDMSDGNVYNNENFLILLVGKGGGIFYIGCYFFYE